VSIVDVTDRLRAASHEDPERRGLSTVARSLIGSEILRIAYEVHAMIDAGTDVFDLTVGDFSSREFPIPDSLRDAIVGALKDGHTNYPPASGVRACREAVQATFEQRLGLRYPLESIIVLGGARPAIAGTYLTLIDPGERIVYGLPSWNNNHYTVMVGGRAIELATDASSNFFPRAVDLEPHLDEARLVCINTPQNPTGTVIEKGELEKISRMIVEENERRKSSGRRALYLMFDQVYWMLAFGEVRHHTPVELVPEIAPYTVFVDGISKGFAATGLRVGWAVGPEDVIKRMGALLTHIGAWAPRPEQVATAKLLSDRAAVDAYLTHMRREVLARLELLSRAVESLRAKGHRVEAIAPQGSIYLSLRVDIRGKKTPDGKTIQTDEDIREYLLHRAHIAMIPFSCFGVREDCGWFRASVGAMSRGDCEAIGPRLSLALDQLS
jgi:aspartate aminotransferase